MRALFIFLSLWAFGAYAELALQKDISAESDCKTTESLVMIHGFHGSAHSWDQWVALFRDDTSLPCLRVYTFSYQSGWGDSLPDIPSIARDLRAALTKIHAENLFLVAHSMGGLILKEMLLQDLEEPQILPTLRHAFFFATPNYGIRRPVPLVAGGKSSQVKELRRPSVRAQRHRWEDVASIKEDGRVELQSASGVYSFYGTAIVGAHDGIVPRYSASGGFSDVLLIDADHSSVKDPASAQDETYQKIKGALQKNSD